MYYIAYKYYILLILDSLIVIRLNSIDEYIDNCLNQVTWHLFRDNW